MLSNLQLTSLIAYPRKAHGYNCTLRKKSPPDTESPVPPITSKTHSARTEPFDQPLVVHFVGRCSGEAVQEAEERPMAGDASFVGGYRILKFITRSFAASRVMIQSKT